MYYILRYVHYTDNYYAPTGAAPPWAQAAPKEYVIYDCLIYLF